MATMSLNEDAAFLTNPKIILKKGSTESVSQIDANDNFVVTTSSVFLNEQTHWIEGKVNQSVGHYAKYNGRTPGDTTYNVSDTILNRVPQEGEHAQLFSMTRLDDKYIPGKFGGNYREKQNKDTLEIEYTKKAPDTVPYTNDIPLGRGGQDTTYVSYVQPSIPTANAFNEGGVSFIIQ